MNSLFSAARQLGDEFVRVLDELAAEDEGESSDRASSSHHQRSPSSRQQSQQQRRGSPPPPSLPKRPRVGPPLALVKSLQEQLRIGILSLTNQNQLNVLIQFFTAPLATGGGSSTHNFARDMGAMGSSHCLDLAEEQSFLFHLFLQLNYLHEADWVTSLSALIPAEGGSSSTSSYQTPKRSTGGQYFGLKRGDQPPPRERCVRFPYAISKLKTLPRELVLTKPSLDTDTMRRFYRWSAMFYQEKAEHEEKLYDYSIEMRRHKKQLQAAAAGGNGGGKKSLPKAPVLPVTRWTIGCSFKGHREGVLHLLQQQSSTSAVMMEEDTSGEDREPNLRSRGGFDHAALPRDGVTHTLMGETVSHRNLLLTHCQRHRLFRDTSPQLLWSSLETRHKLWDLLPTSGTLKPVVIVLQSQDLDVFGCILSGVPPTRGEKQRVIELAGQEEMPFLSFFTFTPTFQFLDVEAPILVPHDYYAASGISPEREDGASPQNTAGARREPELLTSPQASAPPPAQNTASYFMSLGEGDPPSMGRMASKSQPNSPLHPPTAGPTSSDRATGFQAQGGENTAGDGIKRQVSEVALSVDRRDEGGLTVCSRFSIPNPSAPEQAPHMMVVVLELSENLTECRVAAKSASAEVHSGFHFNVAGNNKVSTPTSTTSQQPVTNKSSIDDLAILEDDRKLVPLRAVEVYHMDLIPVFAQGSPQLVSQRQQTTTSSPMPSSNQASSSSTGKPTTELRAPSSAAPPFVVHADDQQEDDEDEEEGPRRIANFDLDEDEWDDVTDPPPVPSATTVARRESGGGGDKNQDSGDFVVLGTMH